MRPNLDDWDDHWDRYGEAAEGNPANDYRRDLIVKLLGSLPPGASLLDIGSGQGQFAIEYQRRHPDVEVWGVEHSAQGVRRSVRAAARAGVAVRFLERDLLEAVNLAEDQPAATHAVCSEVLEHVQNPTALMRNASALLAPGARVVVTVPGGPRSAFDKHIGHFRHFTAPALERVLTDAGLQVERVYRSGFPFFNLYKMAVILRGRRLVKEMDSRPAGARSSTLEAAVTGFFRRGFRLNRDDSRLGWQLAAVAHMPASGQELTC
ncbi:MAG: class I SAM-dependent methyltransferase [Actinomycetota bacterium]|nr:class I SAM-dependent methyltransferase [Actinomycetota bacterium]